MKKEPLPIPLHKKEKEEEKVSNNIKVKFCRNPGLVTSKTYKFKMTSFKSGLSEKLLLFFNNVKKAVEGTGMDTTSEHIYFMSTLLRGKGFHKFY